MPNMDTIEQLTMCQVRGKDEEFALLGGILAAQDTSQTRFLEQRFLSNLMKYLQAITAKIARKVQAMLVYEWEWRQQCR